MSLLWLSRYGAKVALAGVSLIVALGIAEVSARAYYLATYRSGLQALAERYETPAPGSNVTLGDILKPSPYPKIVFEMKPNLDVVFVDVPLRTNSKGWREKEISIVKKAGTVRIVGLGDSFMFGWGVEEDERYMNLLAAQLNQEMGRQAVETAVFAVPGYNLPMQVEVLKRYASTIAPDVVIYAYTDNDYCLPNFIAARKSILSPDLFIESYLSHSMARWGGLLVPRETMRNDSEREFEATYCSENNVPREYRDLVGKENFRNAMVELRDIGRSLGIPVLFLKHLPCARYDGMPLPQGIDYVDLEADYARAVRESGLTNVRDSDLVRHYSDPHPSQRGHQLIATVLRRELLSRGIVSPLTPTRP